MSNPFSQTRPSQCGVSLIEALVAMAVMAFGLLAVVGLQVNLRSNGDLSRQRAEATRIAQYAIEQARSFSVIPTTGSSQAYDEIVTPLLPDEITGANLNAKYTRSLAVVTVGSPPVKSLKVTVSWKDRYGELQSVQIMSAVAGVLPELAGTLALPVSDVPGRRPLGRSPTIPLGAKDFGDGRSGFVPPGQGTNATVVWIFNNSSGLITAICPSAAGGLQTSDLTVAIADTCLADSWQLLSGYVRFASTSVQPTATEAASPRGLPLNLSVTLSPGATSGGSTVESTCFQDVVPPYPPPESAGDPVAYFCAIKSGAAKTWAGRSRIVPVQFPFPGYWTIASSGTSRFKVCRYTTLADDGDSTSKNIDHPLDYTEAGSPKAAGLTNQNFLVISAEHVCPTDTAVSLTHVSNANTRLHQDGSVTYSNP